MLEQAKMKAIEAELVIDFIEADIRMLDLQEKFDLIFIPFNSIHHLYRNEDLFNALGCVRNHLKAGGLFLLDCFNPNIQYIVESEKVHCSVPTNLPLPLREDRLSEYKRRLRHLCLNSLPL